MYLKITPNMLNENVLFQLTTGDGKISSLHIEPFKMMLTNITTDTETYLLIIATDADKLKLGNKALSIAEDSGDPLLIKNVQDMVLSWQSTGKKRGEPVQCITTGEVFANASEAADKHDLTYGALLRHLKGERGYKTVKGKTYVRLEND